MRKILGLTLLALAAAAHADTFTLGGLALNDTGTLALTASAPLTLVGGNVTYSAGPFAAQLGSDPAFRTFCADLGHFAHYGVADSVTIEDTADMSSGYQLAAKLVNAYAGVVGDDPVKNAGLQGAIWKAIYGSDLTIADGTPGAAAQADLYLASDLSGVSDHARFFDTMGADQGQIAPQAVPEPASLAALGLGALGLLRRRRA